MENKPQIKENFCMTVSFTSAMLSTFVITKECSDNLFMEFRNSTPHDASNILTKNLTQQSITEESQCSRLLDDIFLTKHVYCIYILNIQNKKLTTKTQETSACIISEHRHKATNKIPHRRQKKDERKRQNISLI